MKHLASNTNAWNQVAQHKIYSITCAVFILALLARIPIGTFNNGSLLDTVSHFILPATGTPVLYRILECKSLIPGLRHNARLFVMFLLGVTLSVLWEIFEFTIDSIFGTSWQPSVLDTMIDLILGVSGTLIGSLLFLKFYDD